MSRRRDARKAGIQEERRALRRSVRITTFHGGLKDLLAAIQRHPADLVPLLHERATRRVSFQSEATSALPSLAYRSAWMVLAADLVLCKLNAAWDPRDLRDPSLDERWLAELRRGVNIYAQVAWCLRFGHTHAAAALARWSFERWTFNIASSHNIERTPGQSDSEYFNSVWDHYNGIMPDHRAGDQWAEVSDFLHGRGYTIGVSDARYNTLLSETARKRVHNRVLRLAELTLRQVRGAIDTHQRSKLHDHELHTPFLQSPYNTPRLQPSTEPPWFRDLGQPPTQDFVYTDLAKRYAEYGASYRRICTSLSTQDGVTLGNNGLLLWFALEERWVRVIDNARTAFEEEFAQLESRPTPGGLNARLMHYICISEMAHLLALEHEKVEIANSLRVAASALESAWNLWLQDEDAALICLRTVLECTARSRAWRTKTDKTARLEARFPRLTPSRWLELAGWRRLAPLLDVLSDFSHVRDGSRWSTSRELLTQLQREPDQQTEIHTARGAALDEVAVLLGHEVHANLLMVNPDLAEHFIRQLLPYGTSEDAERDLEKLLNHVTDSRNSNRETPAE